MRKRKFIVYVASSADGFIARRDDSVDWHDRPQPKGNYGMGALYRSVDACVMGRTTYEHAVKFGMADGYSNKKNYVLSRTLNKAVSPKISIVNDDLPAFVERLRTEKGKHIWLVGGAELIASFLDAGAVDEFRPQRDPAHDRRWHPVNLSATPGFAVKALGLPNVL